MTAHIVEAQRVAREVLRDTPTDALLTRAYQLTHEMHSANTAARADQRRAMRDMITAEVLRRSDRGRHERR